MWDIWAGPVQAKEVRAEYLLLCPFRLRASSCGPHAAGGGGGAPRIPRPISQIILKPCRSVAAPPLVALLLAAVPLLARLKAAAGGAAAGP